LSASPTRKPATQIRAAVPADFPAKWRIFAAVVAREDTDVVSARAGEEEARADWIGAGVASDVLSYVAEETGQIVGMYKLVASQLDLGDHVANASFMVDARCAGRGIGACWACIASSRPGQQVISRCNSILW
jgi:L-amino acid N-acyltransferase YncA